MNFSEVNDANISFIFRFYKMDSKLYSPGFIVVCGHCSNYVSHSIYMKNIAVEYRHGIKIQQYVFESGYCHVVCGVRKVFCPGCQKIIGLVGDYGKYKFTPVFLSSIRFIYDVCHIYMYKPGPINGIVNKIFFSPF